MPRHILVADDSTTIQRVVQIAFAREDVRLTQSRSMDEALAAARNDRPDCVLADASLDGKSGYDLCAAIKADQQLRTVPVIILTGTAGPWDENKGNKAGADFHIQKPFETQVLIDRVSELIAKAPGRPAAPPPAPAPLPPAPAPAAAPAKPMPPAPRPVPAPTASSSRLFAPTTPAPATQSLPNPPPGLGRPPLIGGGKLGRAAAAVAPKPMPAPEPKAAPQKTMLGLPAQSPSRVATPLARPAPAPAPPKPAPPPAVRAAMSERVAEKVAQFAAAGPEYAAIAKLSREIIEQIVWEVVPELAEMIIRSELDRLVSERDKNR
jgi:CheY-like chemotaxis protein